MNTLCEGDVAFFAGSDAHGENLCHSLLTGIGKTMSDGVVIGVFHLSFRKQKPDLATVY